MRLVVPSGLIIDPVYADYRLGSILKVAKDILNQTSIFLNEVHFCYPNPCSLEIYRQVFGKQVPMRFEMTHAALLFPTYWLHKPLPERDGTLNEILHDHAENLLGDLPKLKTVAELVQREIVMSLHEGHPTMNEIARRLHISQRTLRRQLAEENTGYQALLDRVRASLASLYIQDKRFTIEQIAYQLGFQSDGAFRRAYKRWTNRVLSETAF